MIQKVWFLVNAKIYMPSIKKNVCFCNYQRNIIITRVYITLDDVINLEFKYRSSDQQRWKASCSKDSEKN